MKATEVVGMLSSEMAKFQIQDRVREAESFRTTRATRSVRDAERRSRSRKVARGALMAFLWPVKH
jgi:hypothetical protein